MGNSLIATPKGNSLRGNTSSDILMVKIDPPVRTLRETKNKIKKRKRYTKKPKHMISHVFAETTHVVHIDLHVCSYPRRSYIFHVSLKYVQGFWIPGGGRNLVIPITSAIGFYNSLYYTAQANSISMVQAVMNVRNVSLGTPVASVDIAR